MTVNRFRSALSPLHVALGLAFVVACGSDASNTGGSGLSVEACPGTLACGSACVDADNDPKNCGACGKACEATQVCSVGRCLDDCEGGREKCGETCVDTPGLYAEAEIFTFCSARIAAVLVQESPANIARCPLSIALHASTGASPTVQLGYREPGRDSPGGRLASALLQRIVARTRAEAGTR